MTHLPDYFPSAENATRSVFVASVSPHLESQHFGNHAFLNDLRRVLREIGKQTCERCVPDLEIVPSSWHEGASRPPDHWIRDQFLIGYCYRADDPAPHWVHCARRPDGDLAQYVRQSLQPGGKFASCKLVRDFHCGADQHANYGGNVLSVPGTSIPGSTNPQLMLHGCTGAFAAMLSASATPTLHCDTRWLAVGHVDELVAFLPPTGRLFRPVALLASPRVVRCLLEWLCREPHVTSAFRGKWQPEGNRHFGRQRATCAEALLEIVSAERKGPAENALAELRDTLQHGTELDFIEAPVAFGNPAEPWFPRATEPSLVGCESLLPNAVNMTVLKIHDQTHAILPRMHGPRVPAHRVAALLSRCFRTLGVRASPVYEVQGGLWHWSPPTETAEQVDGYYQTRGTDSWSPHPHHSANEHWTRRWVPQAPPTVDVFEAYMTSVLSAAHVHAWFVDSWEYHTRGGGVHCATNELRQRIPRMHCDGGIR